MKEEESTYKPGSVMDSHSSGMHVAVHLKRPTRERCGPHLAIDRAFARRPRVPLFGLAPGGVYPATSVATGAVRSYRHHFTLTGLESQAVYFLRHFPWTRVPQALPGTLPAGARTFLCVAAPHSDYPVDSSIFSVGPRSIGFNLKP